MVGPPANQHEQGCQDKKSSRGDRTNLNGGVHDDLSSRDISSDPAARFLMVASKREWVSFRWGPLETSKSSLPCDRLKGNKDLAARRD